MSAGEDDLDTDVRARNRVATEPTATPAAAAAGATESGAAAGATAPTAASGSGRVRHDHHVLIDAKEDRWKWRAKIRRNPRQLVFYRMAVALAGLVMICLGLVTGPLPGPGGIPLVLLGIAIWSSEFEWALKLMLWLKRQLTRFRAWPRRRKIVFWIAVVVIGLTCGYTYLRVMGIPFWFPGFLKDALGMLPGV